MDAANQRKGRRLKISSNGNIKGNGIMNGTVSGNGNINGTVNGTVNGNGNGNRNGNGTVNGNGVSSATIRQLAFIAALLVLIAGAIGLFIAYQDLTGASNIEVIV